MSEFVEIKTAELTGAALDWAVAQIDGVKTTMLSPKGAELKKPFALFGSLALPIGDGEQGYAPSSCWHCGGPMIEKHRLDIEWVSHNTCRAETSQCVSAMGRTPLIAACRAIVATVLGETVSVPKELLPC